MSLVEEIEELSNKNEINTDKINNYKKTFKIFLNNFIFLPICFLFILFIFYYILGFIGFLFLHIFRGSNQITLEPTKFQFVNQFFLD